MTLSRLRQLPFEWLPNAVHGWLHPAAALEAQQHGFRNWYFIGGYPANGNCVVCRVARRMLP